MQRWFSNGAEVQRLQCRAGTEQVGRGAEVQRSEMHRCTVQRFSAAEGSASELQSCRGQSFRAAELQIWRRLWLWRCKGPERRGTSRLCSGGLAEVHSRCRGAEMQRCRAGVQVQRSRGVEVVQRLCRAGVQVQRWQCRGGTAIMHG